MTCWRCRKEMVEQEHDLPDAERALQFLTATSLRFWVCACGAREMERL